MTNQEIERKFLVFNLPNDYQEYPSKLIRQTYIAIEDNGTEVRLRKVDNDFILTVKSMGTLVRLEREIKLTEDQYNQLLPVTQDRQIDKTRYSIPYQNHVIELDVFKNNLKGLIIAEIEFTSINEANEFKKLSWMGIEVTSNSNFKNRNLYKIININELIDLL